MNDDPGLETSRGWIWAVVLAAVIAAVLFAWLRPRAAAPAEATPQPAATDTGPAEPAAAEAESIVVARETDPALVQLIATLPRVPTTAGADEAAAATPALREQLARAAGEDGGARPLAHRPPAADGVGVLQGYRARCLRAPDHFLANAVHVARVLGKRRTIGLARSLAAADDELEPLAAASYRWLITRENSSDEQERSITLSRLYDYATFLLETYGGRSYLLRRLPRQEALASFYALLLVDHARRAGISHHGTDPRPHLARCRGLLETQDLAYRESYLAAIDALR